MSRARRVTGRSCARCSRVAPRAERRPLEAGSAVAYCPAMDRPVFPLIVHDDERATLRLALQTYRDDLGHEEHRVAEVVEGVAARVPDDEHAPLELDAADMKVTWSALHTLLD